jgi:hypothetical protein
VGSKWRTYAPNRLRSMWPAYLIYVAYATALLAAVATVPVARRGARRLLWCGWITVALVLPLAATSGATRLVPPSMWPAWRFAVLYVLLLAAPTGVAALVADQLARRRPMPATGRHAAIVACAIVATIALCAVVSRPLTPNFAVLHTEQ